MKYRQKQLVSTLNDFYDKPVAKVSLELFLSILLIIALGAFAIQPTLVTMSKLIKEIEEKETLDKNLTTKISALNSAQTAYLAAQDDLLLLDEALPPQPHLITTLKMLEKMATENNVIVTSLSVSEIPPEETINTAEATEFSRESVGVVVSVRGDYLSIRDYVQALLGSRRAILVDSVSFNLEETRRSESLQASISLNVPFFPAE